MQPEQCKMARAALGWGVLDLKAKSGVSHDSITRFERGENLRPATVEKLQAAFEEAGLEFLPSNGKGPGVRFAKPARKR